jgi:hypothetical protein
MHDGYQCDSYPTPKHLAFQQPLDPNYLTRTGQVLVLPWPVSILPVYCDLHTATNWRSAKSIARPFFPFHVW